MLRLDFSVIVCLHILHQVFQITGPCSRILQSTWADIAVVAQLVRQCCQKIAMIRHDENLWHSLITKAQQFAVAHDVDADLFRELDDQPSDMMKIEQQM